MVDAVNESTSANYARRDAQADRLWLSQRTKVNPWGRQASEQGDSEEREPDAEPEQKPAKPGTVTLIAQDDTLALHQSQPSTEVYNPFARLLGHNKQPHQ